MKEDRARYFAGLMEDFLHIPAFMCERIERKLVNDKYEEVINYVIDRKQYLEQEEKK